MPIVGVRVNECDKNGDSDPVFPSFRSEFARYAD